MEIQFLIWKMYFPDTKGNSESILDYLLFTLLYAIIYLSIIYFHSAQVF